MAQRLIDADVLIEGRVGNDPVVIAAMCAPTVDAVPVVRCRECRYWYDDPDTYGASDGPKGTCDNTWVKTAYDDFCSFGERSDS